MRRSPALPTRPPSRRSRSRRAGGSWKGRPRARHAIAVATGRDSVVVGEDQILHQLREALEAARASGALEAEVDRLFGLALRAGRRARSWRSGRQRSLADVALERVERTIGPLRDREILVVGAGRMGELLARSAAARGASVAIANRSEDRALAVAAGSGAALAAFDPGADAGRFDAIFVALAGRWTIADTTIAAFLDRASRDRRPVGPDGRPAALAAGLGGSFVTADDLALGDAERRDPRTRSRTRGPRR